MLHKQRAHLPGTEILKHNRRKVWQWVPAILLCSCAPYSDTMIQVALNLRLFHLNVRSLHSPWQGKKVTKKSWVPIHRLNLELTHVPSFHILLARAHHRLAHNSEGLGCVICHGPKEEENQMKIGEHTISTTLSLRNRSQIYKKKMLKCLGVSK